MPTASASTHAPSTATEPPRPRRQRRGHMVPGAEQADAEQLDEGGEGHRRGQRQTRAGERQDKPARQARQVEALEHGLEHDTTR